MDFSPENLRARFHDLSAQVSTILEDLEPIRNELENLVAGDSDLPLRDARAREAEIRDLIKAGQAQLVPLERERATIVRALGGKTGPLQQDAHFLATM